MPAEITKEFIFDIFNIRRDGSNIVDEEDEFQNATEDTRVLFGEKAKEVDASISIIPQGMHLSELPVNLNPVIETKAASAPSATAIEDKHPPEEKKEVKPMPAKDNVVEEAAKKVMNSKLFGDLFDDDETGAQPKTELPQAEPEKDEPVVQETNVEPETPPWEESVAPDNKAQQPSAPMSDPTPSNGRGHRWKLQSPAPKYEKLYEEKRDLLSNHLLKSGEIPFSKFYEELEDANVDVDVPTFDTEEVGRRISEVQKWRDRVKFIQLRVNSQYFVWKAIIEILPGVLARIEYERGKNEGIVYEHLNDFTTYFGHLEGLHKSCEAVSKHLDGAYNSLSRQVAIAQPLQEVERFTNSGPKPLNPQLQKWDSLTHANKGSNPVRPKEAPLKGAEPSSGWGDV